MTFSIEVENKFEISQRDIYVVCKGDTREQHRVCYPGNGKPSAVKIPLDTVGGVEISVDNHQYELGPCRIGLPSPLPFSLTPEGIENVEVMSSGDRTFLRIPAGLPIWKLAISRLPGSMFQYHGDDPGPREGGGDSVTVGDDGPGGEPGWD